MIQGGAKIVHRIAHPKRRFNLDVGQLWRNRANTEDVEPRLLVERGHQKRAVAGIIKE